MQIHDWSRVGAGVFHDFHTGWIIEIRNALNGGLLPPDYYAQAQQVLSDTVPDALTLRSTPTNGFASDESPAGLTSVSVLPPCVQFTAKVELDPYAERQRVVALRRTQDDRAVAFIEIVSRGNKSSRQALNQFLEKAVNGLRQGLHLLIVDLQPPTARDPQGIHGALWADLKDNSYQAPQGKPLTAVSYAAGTGGQEITAYIQPLAVGDWLPDMPLFLEQEAYVPVPLEATYVAAFRGIPERWRRVLEAKGG